MAIPRIIHQTAATTDLSAWCLPLRQRIVRLHPDWNHRFYDDTVGREVLRREFPHLLPLYDNYRSNIQRVDLFRIVAVYVSGGFYIDLDIECHKPLDSLCEYRCVLGEEKTLTLEEAAYLGHRDALRVANYMFGSEPRHPFWLDVLEEMLRQAERKIVSENDILESTGPGLWTTVYHRVKDRHPDLILLKNDHLSCRRCGAISCQFGDFASHLHVGSWRWEWSLSPGPRSIEDGRAGSLIDHQHKHQILELDREVRALPDDCLVLRTYSEREHDGLTSVFAKVQGVGTLVDDTRHLTGHRVLVAGVPFLYVQKLSPRNTNILYTTFESTRLPRHWVDVINTYYHLCIVPHKEVEQVFYNSGVRIPLHVIQQGFTRYRRQPEFRSPQEVFRIGFMGVPVRRKNLHKLFDACLQLCDEIPSLRLAVHVSQFYDWLDRTGWNHVQSAPFVEWSEGVWPRDKVAAWYESLSCYVYPSSAEGWSFTPRESMFLGVPTILTAIPMHADLVQSGFCTTIPVDGLEPAAYEGGVFGAWSHVRTEDIKHAIKEVYRNPGTAERRARDGARWIEGKWLDADMQVALRNLLGSG